MELAIHPKLPVMEAITMPQRLSRNKSVAASTSEVCRALRVMHQKAVVPQYSEPHRPRLIAIQLINPPTESGLEFPGLTPQD